MIYYADTGFLCSLYRDQVHSDLASALRQKLDDPLHFTSLLEFEFIQAIELQVYLYSQDRNKGYSRAEADRMLADWESDVAKGINRLVSFDMDAVLRLSKSLSTHNTARGGHRTLDILHVATAVHLGATRFLTFDSRQKALAIYAELEVPPPDRQLTPAFPCPSQKRRATSARG